MNNDIFPSQNDFVPLTIGCCTIESVDREIKHFDFQHWVWCVSNHRLSPLCFTTTSSYAEELSQYDSGY